MKDKIEKIVSELNASIQVGELELYDIVQNAPSMILTMENTFEELKTTVSEYCSHNAKQSDRSIDPSPIYDMVCLSCGSESLAEVKKTRGNNRYFYTYSCNNSDCQHTIYIDYCWNCKTKLFKHGSYWDYHKTSVWSIFDIHCPCCGMTVADMPSIEYY